MANHVRFIDDHCVDSEEIRTEMQKDIDRLVAQLEDQEKQNRTTSSLQTQVQRLEGNFVQNHVKNDDFSRKKRILSSYYFKIGYFDSKMTIFLVKVDFLIKIVIVFEKKHRFFALLFGKMHILAKNVFFIEKLPYFLPRWIFSIKNGYFWIEFENEQKDKN